jgi:aspartate dehydrogenase
MDNSFIINRFCNLIKEPDQARKAGNIVIDEALPATEPANMVLRESAAVTAQSQRIGKPSMGNLVKSQPSELRVAIAGLGSIGTKVAEALDRGIDGLTLAAVSVQNPDKHQSWLGNLTRTPAVLPIEALCDVADIVIECAPSKLLRSIVAPFVASGKTAIVLSAGALLDNEDLIELARQNGGQIVVPTGALIGLDAVTAAAAGTIHSVRMVTRKPVGGLAGAPYIVENNIDIERITEPLRIFDGTAREAARGFPANLNVAVALSLAGIGPDRTKLEIWADPTVTRNMHRIEVESDSARFSMSIENIPSENPKTGRITALSVIAYLRKQRAPLRVGT